jgi:hypothetical protein
VCEREKHREKRETERERGVGGGEKGEGERVRVRERPLRLGLVKVDILDLDVVDEFGALLHPVLFVLHTLSERELQGFDVVHGLLCLACCDLEGRTLQKF